MHQKDLAKIDRSLLAKLEALTKEEVNQATKDFLTRRELDAMMVRRDLLVAHFKKLVAELGEAKVLYSGTEVRLRPRSSAGGDDVSPVHTRRQSRAAACRPTFFPETKCRRDSGRR